MTFEKALAALKKGAVIHIPARSAGTMTRLSPRGEAQRRFGVGWIGAGTLSMDSILSDEWEVDQAPPTTDK